MNGEVTAGFLPTARGRLLAVVYGDLARARRRLLVVPAFGDEMNKSRHLVAAVARRIVSAGVATIVPDLHGTGDSDGEFEDASWDDWVDDLREVAHGVMPHGRSVDAILAIRSGALLAAAACGRYQWPLRNAVLWQPVLDGSRFLMQMLRMRVAAEMGGETRVTASELRARLLGGETLEVGVYRIPPAVAAGLDAARLPGDLDVGSATVHWFEVGGDALPPASSAFVVRARESGVNIYDHPMPGEPFWGAAELARLPQLVEATAAVLEAA